MTSQEREIIQLLAKLALEAHNAALPQEHASRLALHQALTKLGQLGQEPGHKLGRSDHTERDLGRAVDVLNDNGPLPDPA